MTNSDLSTFPGRLHFARELADVSARSLSKLAGLAESHVSLIEAQRKKEGPAWECRSATGDKLARTLGVSLEWLLTGRGRAPSKAAVRAAVGAAERRVKRASAGKSAAGKAA